MVSTIAIAAETISKLSYEGIRAGVELGILRISCQWIGNMNRTLEFVT
jgi:hypothetical protein